MNWFYTYYLYLLTYCVYFWVLSSVYLVCESESVSHSVVSDSLWPHRIQPTGFLCQWNSPGKNTEVGCYSLLQGIFPTQELNLGLLHCRQILYHQGSYQGSLVSYSTYCRFEICLEIWTYDAWRFCSSFLRLLWIFCIFCVSIWSLRLFVFYYCKKKKCPMGSNGDIIEFVDGFGVVYCEHNTNTQYCVLCIAYHVLWTCQQYCLPIHEHQMSFHLFVCPFISLIYIL